MNRFKTQEDYRRCAIAAKLKNNIKPMQPDQVNPQIATITIMVTLLAQSNIIQTGDADDILSIFVNL